MNLIANSGIQYFSFPIEINKNDNFRMYFHEWFDEQSEELHLEIAHYFSDEDIWVKKFDLTKLGYAIFQNNFNVTENWDSIKEYFFEDGNQPIEVNTNDELDSGCFQISLGGLKWDKLENTWLPLPFFLLNGNKSEFGPTNWCRFKLIPKDTPSSSKRYDLLLAFDTRTLFEITDSDSQELNETPKFNNDYEKSKEFSLCNNEYSLINYCSEDKNCGWIDKYLLKIFHQIDDIKDYRGEKPKLKYLAQYVTLIKYMQQLDVLPKVTLYSNKNVICGDVDLVVDIGNSRTCAVLYDNADFTKTSPLELRDFTDPVIDGEINKSLESFDMRLAFREADFGGRFGIVNSKQFVYPSMIRLGKEANKLIHKATNLNTGIEKTSTFSSPKRFLWDTKPQTREWEFIQLEGETSRPIYIDGISKYLNSDGSIDKDGHGGGFIKYSRKALMTLSFLEILAQANIQINSHEQRSHWGNESMPRKIGRVIVTCPTSMSRVEQIALRKCAEDAGTILDLFFNESKNIDSIIQVIPASINLKKTENRKEWIYDEATASQFVFLYAEIGQRYMKNVKDYFDFYGKSKMHQENDTGKVLTIGSLDVGAGTTDVMIANYDYEAREDQCVLTPTPVFWESFYKAGDDLMKELIHQLIIEGSYSPIEKKMKTLGFSPEEITDKNNDFFGGNTGMSFRNKQLRSDFNLQVSVPIVSHLLELIKQNDLESKILSFSDLFTNNPPTKVLINHFKQHFGFDLETLQWQFERKVVSAIIEKTFDLLIGKVSSLFSYYECDIVLLSGRLTSLKPLTDLFLKYYAISPNRLKSMNDYRVGKWYPQDKRHKFIDGNGKFKDPKSIITTGAMIANIAGNGGINGFSLNLEKLKQKLLPNTNFFGKLNEQFEYYETIISPESNHQTIEISTLPFRIGVRQIDVGSYPSRPFYNFNFNEFNLEDRVKGRLKDAYDTNAVHRAVTLEKEKIKAKMPLKVTISRDYSQDLELLHFEDVIDKNGDSVNSNLFILQVQSMTEIDDFWLDSGVFSLNINANN